MYPSIGREYSALTQDEEKAQVSNLTSLSSEDGSSKSEFTTQAQTPSTNTKLRSTFVKFLGGKGPWVLSTILLFCTTLAMSAKNGGVYEHQGSFETGFNTDFSTTLSNLSTIVIDSVELVKLLIEIIR